MLINVTDDESRIAVVEDNLLQDMLIEHETREQLKNNIYKGVVVQIQTALQAAFVDFGNKKHGFLPNSEINPIYFHSSNARKDSPIQQKLKVGQEIIVQVTREAIEHKGAALTTNVTIPGRFMVMMPDSDKGGVSKKIEDEEERNRLKSFLSGIEAEEHAVIIRTAGMGRDLVELKKDYTSLKKTWADINRSFRSAHYPGLLQEEDDVVTRTLRDYYTEDISEIWVDNAETFQKALIFFKKNAPRRQKDLKLFVGDRSLFATHNIERQVEQLTAREVKLRSGGSIVIDQTEALVAIDVNSGKSNKDENIDDTALRTNMEAAKEIARQLRLRNLGGLVVVDFIDMETDASRRKVEQQIQNSMSRDKAQRKYNPISQFGLLEMSRQRLTQGISRTVESVCPTCAGKGKIPSVAASTNLILRSIREIAAKGNLIRIEGELPLELANTLLNERRQSITDLELEFGINISLKGNPDMVSFNDRCLKPTYDGKAPQRKNEENSRKDRNKNDRSNRRHKDQDQIGKHGRNDKLASSKQEKDSQNEKRDSSKNELKTSHNKQDAPDLKFESSAIPPEHIAQQKQEEEKKKEEVVKTLDTNEADRIEKPKKAKPEFVSTLHSACLFSEINEPSDEELAKIILSFENRLKGKSDDKPFIQYAAKYLWQAEPKEAHVIVEEANEALSEETLNEKGAITEESNPESVETDLLVEKNADEVKDDFSSMAIPAEEIGPPEDHSASEENMETPSVLSSVEPVKNQNKVSEDEQLTISDVPQEKQSAQVQSDSNSESNETSEVEEAEPEKKKKKTTRRRSTTRKTKATADKPDEVSIEETEKPKRGRKSTAAKSKSRDVKKTPRKKSTVSKKTAKVSESSGPETEMIPVDSGKTAEQEVTE